MGLSASPVVGAVMAGVIAIATTFIGLIPENDDAANNRWPKPPLQRLTAFACACLLAVLAGLWMRTHDFLSPSMKAQARDLKDAGLDDATVRQILVVRSLAILPVSPSRSSSEKAEKNEKEDENHKAVTPALATANLRNTTLFATHESSRDHLDPTRLADANEVLSAWRDAGGSWKELADDLEKSSNAEQRHERARQVWTHLEAIRILLSNP